VCVCARHTMHAPVCVRCARLCLTALCAAAFYRLGSTGSDACPSGSTRIDSATVCQGAAAALGRSWGWPVSSSGVPTGCYYAVSSGYVLFNTHATGASSAKGQPLCFAGAPLSPQPPCEPCPTPATECPWRSPVSTHGPYASQGRPRRRPLRRRLCRPQCRRPKGSTRFRWRKRPAARGRGAARRIAAAPAVHAPSRRLACAWLGRSRRSSVGFGAETRSIRCERPRS
jgi:hypothetical protein